MFLFFLSLVDSHFSISILIYRISNNNENASNFEDIQSSRVILEKSTNFQFFDSYLKRHHFFMLGIRAVIYALKKGSMLVYKTFFF